jgi:putative ABC transport system substrate-binding protein
VRRREFITLLGGATAAWPLAARAQQGERVRRIGVLIASTADDPEAQARIAAFAEALSQLGWTDGRNVRIDVRWATTNADGLRRHAAELAALGPDVIVAATGTATVAPLLQATRTVPIVFVVVIDPVGAGFVASMNTFWKPFSAALTNIRRRCASGAKRSSIHSAQSRPGWEQHTS